MAAGAFDALASLGSLMAPVLQIAEIRTVAPDDLWLSPSFQRDTVALHFTWIRDTAAVTPVIAAMEHLLTPLGARPHWAKVFGMPPHVVRALYPRSADFQDLLSRYDPDGKFRNGFIDKYFPPRH
jgi:xylitol oxidase